MSIQIENHVKDNRCNAFINYVIDKIKKDKGVAAALRRADNPSTEYQSWEQLAQFRVELDRSNIRLPFATIAAAIAKAKIEVNGNLGIGAALAQSYQEGCESDQAKTKLRRLLVCHSVEEVCRILRSLFGLITAKQEARLDYARLLNELLLFHTNSARIKTRWAEDFYHTKYKIQE